MAKLTDLTSLTNIAGNDEFYVVDVSDTSESAQGTSKKITRDEFSLGVNHTSLASLLIDSHTQYALLSGRGTGQTLNGGSNASGSLTLDSTANATKGNIILNSGGGSVGIGTTSPSNLLHIQGTAPTIRVQDNQDNRPALIEMNNSTLTIWSVGPSTGSGVIRFLNSSGGGSERMRIDGNGDVGIGTTSPQGKLDISWGGTSNNDFSAIMGADIGSFSTRTNNTDKYAALALPHYTNSEENVVGFVMYSGATNTSINYGGSSGNGNAANVLGFYTAPTNTTTGGTERMRIDRNGAVGFKITPADWNTTYSPIQVGRTVLYDTGTGGYYGWNFYNNASGFNRHIGSGEQGVVGFEGGSFDVYSGLSAASGAATGVALVLSLKKDRTLALQGALQTLGVGISFPSTQSASTDANTLDDYEEGSWNPIYEPQTGSFTAVTYDGERAGRYVKIGNTVFVSGVIITDAVTLGTAGGNLFVGGLPFTVSNTPAGFLPPLHIGYSISFASTTRRPTGGLFNQNTTRAFLYYRASSEGDSTNVQPSNLATGTNSNYMMFSGFYQV